MSGKPCRPLYVSVPVIVVPNPGLAPSILTHTNLFNLGTWFGTGFSQCNQGRNVQVDTEMESDLIFIRNSISCQCQQYVDDLIFYFVSLLKLFAGLFY